MNVRPRKVRRELFERQEGKCFYCKEYFGGFVDGVKGAKATIDHVIPKSAGGWSTLDNYVLACSKCNSLKADKLDFHPIQKELTND